jgi:hypothetical protein
MPKLVMVESQDNEEIRIIVDGTEIFRTNYEECGRSGLKAVQRLVREMSDALSLGVEEKEAAPPVPAITFEVDAMFGGTYRVALFVNGSLVNRRRDVAPERIETVKAALLTVQGLTSAS